MKVLVSHFPLKDLNKPTHTHTYTKEGRRERERKKERGMGGEKNKGRDLYP